MKAKIKRGVTSKGALENATGDNSGELQAVSEPDSVVVATNKGGRPSKYTPGTIDPLLAALADGLTQKQACIACGIGESTLSDWLERYPELTPRLQEARETARRKALAVIRSAGKSDWRAMAEFLRFSFPADYRRDGTVNVSATATTQQASLVCDQATRKKLIELREAIRAPVPVIKP
jgi:Homeodomain-like domain